MDDTTYARTCDLQAVAHVQAMSFIKSEARKGRKSIGFIPWSGIEKADKLGRVSVLLRNSDLVGFLVYGPGKTSAKVFQVWVREDARMLIHGRKMVEELAEWALHRGLFRISLWCADDLPSNYFWRVLGFKNVARRKGGRHSGRMHTRYVQSAIDLEASRRARCCEPRAQLSQSNPLPLPPVSEAADQTAPRRQTVLCDPT